MCKNAIADSIPEFYFGRFDLRFESIEKLQRGEGFKLVEINGAGGEATHIWDRKTTLRQAYATLFEQNRLLFEIGALQNIVGPDTTADLGLMANLTVRI